MDGGTQDHLFKQGRCQYKAHVYTLEDLIDGMHANDLQVKTNKEKHQIHNQKLNERLWNLISNWIN